MQCTLRNLILFLFLVSTVVITGLLYKASTTDPIAFLLANITDEVDRLSRELFPIATRCAKDAVLCGIDYTAEGRHLVNATAIDDLKLYFLSLMALENSSLCREFRRFGHSGDGGYDVCMTSPFVPQPGSCLVYSFGVKNDWTFDEAMSAYGCEVHSFDPSLGQEDHIHSPDVRFHNVGLWGDDITNSRGWQLQKLSTIRSRLGHESRVLDVLKVDVEAAEWPFFRNLVDVEPSLSHYITQLIVEAHTPHVWPRQLIKADLAEMIYYAKRLTQLGFTLVHNRQVNYCCGRFSPLMPKPVSEKCCYEIFYVNTRFLN